MTGFDLFANLGITERDLIKSIIASRFPSTCSAGVTISFSTYQTAPASRTTSPVATSHLARCVCIAASTQATATTESRMMGGQAVSVNHMIGLLAGPL